MLTNAPKGTKDLLPNHSYKWQWLEQTMREHASLFCIREIRTPIFEHTELFLRGVGDTTDIVQKEMYTFDDKGNRSITLKPEGTAPAVRAYIENGLHNEPQPIKVYYFTPVFRYERPQAGRFRQHHQFGIEYFGAQAAISDAEIIQLGYNLIHKLGIQDVQLKINSIGCDKCRAKYNEELIEYFKSNIDSICGLCKDRLEKNPLRILDCKDDDCSKVNENAPVILDYICDECTQHFEALQGYLNELDIKFIVDPGIVRGLDYYTKTVFEFVYPKAGYTICGGGRYDNLIESIGGRPTPAAGFGMGIERIISVMEMEGIQIPQPDLCDIYIASMGAPAQVKAISLADSLRRQGYKVEINHMERSFKAQFKYADKLAVKNVIIIGDDELKNQTYKIKNMTTGEEKLITENQILEGISWD